MEGKNEVSSSDDRNLLKLLVNKDSLICYALDESASVIGGIVVRPVVGVGDQLEDLYGAPVDKALGLHSVVALGGRALPNDQTFLLVVRCLFPLAVAPLALILRDLPDNLLENCYRKVEIRPR